MIAIRKLSYEELGILTKSCGNRENMLAFLGNLHGNITDVMQRALGNINEYRLTVAELSTLLDGIKKGATEI